ncbi:hypothetical protein [Actinophytocola sp.]|uniref:hypothetical protein n=1 Tax=Actinophytocola sp. TaxID=1872138 RepID=UPI002ED055AF
MRGIESLREAIRTVPVPGAPARMSLDGAALGMSFLDTSLRLNHVRRLTERITVVEHRAARRTIEVDVNLRMLDEGQRQAAALCHTHMSHERGEGSEQSGPLAEKSTLWVPVARISRQSVAPVDVFDGSGRKLPRLTQYETSRLLASGLYRLLRSVLMSHQDARSETRLNHLLQQNHELRWLIQWGLQTLLTDRSQPESRYERRTPSGVIEGRGADVRRVALEILDENGKYAELLEDYNRLLDIAINEYLLVVALDTESDEHLLTYEAPVRVKVSDHAPNRVARMLRANSRGYHIEYEGRVPASLRSYHLVVDVEDELKIERMYLTTDADRASADRIVEDLETLAELSGKEAGTRDRPTTKLLELETQTTLRHLSELVRRRRWDADQAGFVFDSSRLRAVTDLCWAAVSGEATESAGGQADNSILNHPFVAPEKLGAAAEEVRDARLSDDLSLGNDPTTRRAHVYWRRRDTRDNGGAQITVRAGLILRDTTAAGPGSVFWYALSVAAIAHSVMWFLTKHLWPYSAEGARNLVEISDRDAIIAVLLLVPGLLYTRLTLPDRQSITGHLRAVPRMAAKACIVVMAFMAAALAAGVGGMGLVVIAAITVSLSVVAAIAVGYPEFVAWLARRRHKKRSIEQQLRGMRVPAWVDPGRRADGKSVAPDVIFSWRAS